MEEVNFTLKYFYEGLLGKVAKDEVFESFNQLSSVLSKEKVLQHTGTFILEMLCALKENIL